MGDDFERRLYALIAEYGPDDEAFIKHFRAKGDAAPIYAALYPVADTEGLDEDLLELMLAFGVPLPAGKLDVQPQKLFSNGIWHLRDVTVAELKASVALGKWPDDAWTYSSFTWRDNIRLYLALPVVVLGLLVAIPIFLIGQLFRWAKRAIMPTSA